MDIMIVEDDELMAMDMERMIESMGHEVRGMATSSDEALALLEDRYVDLAILDIRIQGQYDGIELAEQISRLDEGILILFVTSMQDDLTFNRASRSQPAGFVVKPFTEIQFRRTVELILKQKEQQTTGLESRHPESDVEFNPQALFIRKRNEIKKIFFRDIQYLEADGGKYSKIYLGDDVFVVRFSLQNLMDKISSDDFIQCHRSYVVNLKRIKTVDLSNNLVMFDTREVPVSRREKTKLMERLDYLK